MYIDVHCHLTGDEYAEVGGVGAVITRAQAAGVSRIICSGFDLNSSKQAAALADEYESVYFCAGFHPSELDKYKDGDLDGLRKLCLHEKCVAVGEIGLDYHYENNPPKETQKTLFVQQLQIAHELQLPVVLHSRDAAQDTIELLETHAHLLTSGGLMHCYSYSPEMADRFLKLGLCFSFGGTSTFKNAKKVQESVRQIPATRILSETDCPYLSPEPFRGCFPNEPARVVAVVKKLAELKTATEEELKTQILENAKALFSKLH
ncbi:MAG: TatD family hydrolase [Clostridia bacterium]|nr:TatD family hydrolase [Clostridia bacterium]